MKLATVCSGIGAPELAASVLGWDCLFQAEIDSFPREVLQHHYPSTKLYGDFANDINKRDWLDKIDCMVAGPPCQSFSVAGKKGGIKDKRGNLSLEYVRLVQETRTQWGVFENVPGLLTNDFGHVINAITGRDDLHHISQWSNAGVIERGESGYSAAWRVLDSQFFGVPQRRRRVFVIFYAGEWQTPAEVLFEQESSTRDITKNKRKRQGTTKGISNSTDASRKEIVYENHEQDARYKETGEISPTLRASMSASGCNVPIVLQDHRGERMDIWQNGNIPTQRESGGPPIVLQPHTFKTRSGKEGGGKGYLGQDETTFTIATSQDQYLYADSILRYLTPTEIERCFGFPDGWTDIEGASKGKRYKALGNSMAVPVLSWILRRIELVNEEIT